ncbi:hypothetical protein BJP34_01520 [Moorena producens PAL-8-15-08-1]|uniref:DoxX family protein n=1 Tax=Moorena producens PAL-8-15-08-1 TaxID=1458985 RepID=A0A1D8TL10_9CYAN|nr:DUF6326 family protein [Moorena producens]AOW98294.1 hypothetical protein BJP34_01520 [Moorena producens PAL-8-15-08-1]
MIYNKKTIGIDRKALLSTLWLFFLLNMIFRDIHEFFRPGLLEEIMTGIVNGTKVTDGMLLVGSIMMEIPISMVLLSRVLNYRLNRWANIIAGAITIAFVIGIGPKDLDDMFFSTIEVVSLSLIVWYA